MHNAPLYKRWRRDHGEAWARRSFLIILACATVIAFSFTWLLFLPAQ